MLDLDNTLVDRDGAFRECSRGFAAEHGGTEADVLWMIDADAGGMRSRHDLANEVRSHFELDQPSATIIDRIRDGIIESIRCYEGVLGELAALSAEGARLVVVTNGESRQQRRKIATAALEALVDDIVISGEAGAKKPDALIFERALGHTAPSDAWMLGDNPDADIAGARALGIATGWVSHGRNWAEHWLPDRSAETTVELLQSIRGDHRS